MALEHEKAKSPATAPLQRRKDTAAAPTPQHDRAAALRNVQRIAGNQGLIRLLEQRQPAVAVVQRLTTTADLDKVMGGSNTRAFLGKGASSYAELRKALAKYEAGKGKPAPEVVKLLEQVGTMCMDWLNAHKGSSPRHDLLRTLMDQVGAESLALSKKAAEARYLESTAAGLQGVAKGSGPLPPVAPNFEHRLKVGIGPFGASSGSNYEWDIENSKRMAPDEETHQKNIEWIAARREFRAKYNISAAEDAAIRAYTWTDGNAYSMMSAASGNDKDWLEAIEKSQGMFSRAGGKAIREEGGLHAAVATQGILKLPRFRKVSYRGESVTQKEFDALKPGTKHTFKGLTSTSKFEGKGDGFATLNMTQARPIGLLWVMTNVGGRDVSQLSQGGLMEGEVLLPPGTSVVITAIRYLRDHTNLAGKGPVYRIETVPGSDGPTPHRPTRLPALPQAPLKTTGRGPMPGLPTPPGG